MEKLKPPRKPLDPRVKRFLITGGLGVAFGLGCRFLPPDYQVICSIIGKLLVGGISL